MIDHRDAEQLADGAQPARQRDVLGARRRIARRMVVHEHAARRRHAHQRAEHLARVDLDAVDRAARDLDDIEQAVADVDAEHEEDLLREAGDLRARRRGTRPRAARAPRGTARTAMARRPSSNAAAMRAARAVPMPVTSESSRGEARESAAMPPDRRDEVGGDCQRGAIADTGAEHDREQLLVADAMTPRCQHALARSIVVERSPAGRGGWRSRVGRRRGGWASADMSGAPQQGMRQRGARGVASLRGCVVRESRFVSGMRRCGRCPSGILAAAC